MIEKIYLVSFNHDGNRPHFEVGSNTHVDYATLDAFADGSKRAEDVPSPALSHDHPEASDYDYYPFNGNLSLFSQRAIDTLGLKAFKNFELLPASVNGQPYHLMSLCRARTDCFDKAHSRYVECDPPERLLFSIASYAFFPDKIADPAAFFSIPEAWSYFFCTDVLAGLIETHLKGFGLIALFDCKKGRPST
jgi:hypothetical protein